MATIPLSVIVALAMSGAPAVNTESGSVSLRRAAGTLSVVAAAESAGQQRSLEAWMIDRPVRRPAALPSLYASLGALHALDAYSTRRAMAVAAHEGNPAMRNAAGNAATLLAVKAASTAATIFLAERAWKKSRKGAVILMVAINGAMAAVSARNFRNAQRLER